MDQTRCPMLLLPIAIEKKDSYMLCSCAESFSSSKIAQMKVITLTHHVMHHVRDYVHQDRGRHCFMMGAQKGLHKTFNKNGGMCRIADHHL